MEPLSLVFIAIGIGIAYFMYRSAQMTNQVPPEHQVEIPEGGLEAIEYYWRPG